MFYYDLVAWRATKKIESQEKNVLSWIMIEWPEMHAAYITEELILLCEIVITFREPVGLWAKETIALSSTSVLW